MFYKMVFLNFLKFHKNTPLLDSLFNKVAGLQACPFFKKRLQHRCFHVEFELFSRPPFFTEYLRYIKCFCKYYTDFYSKLINFIYYEYNMRQIYIYFFAWKLLGDLELPSSKYQQNFKLLMLVPLYCKSIKS